MLVLVEVVGEVFGDEAIEKSAENVLFEVPTVDASAEVIGDLPDRLVELGSFDICHEGNFPPSVVNKGQFIGQDRQFQRFELQIRSNIGDTWHSWSESDMGGLSRAELVRSGINPAAEVF